MSEGNCLKCGTSYSQGAKRCLLCGAEIFVTPVVSQPTKKKRKKSKSMDAPNVPFVGEEIVVEEQVEDEPVPPFDDTGGFSKRVNKKDQIILQLQADNEALRKELANFEEIYKREHPKGKPWYASFGVWFALLLAAGMGYAIHLWIEYEGGVPHEIYGFFRRIF